MRGYTVCRDFSIDLFNENFSIEMYMNLVHSGVLLI